MVARGDLGVEIPPEDVPGRQKELVRAVPPGGQAGDDRHADAGIDDQVAVADARRGLRRGDRDLRQRRRGHALGRVGVGRLSGRGGGHDGSHHPPHREAPALPLDHRRAAAQPRAHGRRTRSPPPPPTSPPRSTPARSSPSRRAAPPRCASRASARACRSSAARPMPAWRDGSRCCGAPTASSRRTSRATTRWSTARASTPLPRASPATGDRIVVVAGIPFGRAGSTNNIRVVRV